MNEKIKYLLRESNLIEGYNNAEYDAQAWIAWELMLTVPFDKFDHEHIQKVQEILTLKQTDLQPDWRGYYRRIPVWVGGHEAMPWPEIRRAMDAWIGHVVDGMLPPLQCHVEFERIHPFADGNGRTGRLLLWWQQTVIGQPLTVFNHQDRQSYYALFKTDAQKAEEFLNLENQMKIWRNML